MLHDANRHLARLQSGDSLQEEPQQVHRVLPPDRTMVPQIALEFAELRHQVAVERLVDELREKCAAHREELLCERRRFLHDRRPEAFEHRRIRLQRERDDLLELPVALLRRRVFELLRHAEE